MKKTAIAKWDELQDRDPVYALVEKVDLVVVRYDDQISVMYGRCLHRGALLADGRVDGENLICGVHGWDFRFDSGVSSYNDAERLKKFEAWIEDGEVLVDADEIGAWESEHPQPYDRDAYQGLYQDPHGSPDEPLVGLIQEYAKHGLSKTGHHGVVSAMGVSRGELPMWDDIQFVTAQLHKPPHLDDMPVGTDVTIGPGAKRPLHLNIPLFVSDMSFGALSEPAKVALARSAELAGTGICSGEGGMLPEEQAENSRYFYELASGRFGFSMDKLSQVQAFHFKGGQGAKTGTGGICPATRSRERSPSSASSTKERRRSRRRGFPNGPTAPSSAISPMRCAKQLAAFPSGSNCRRNISKRISTRHCKSAVTISFWMDAVAERAPHRSYSATISQCRRSRHWRGRDATSINSTAATSRWSSPADCVSLQISPKRWR